MHARASQWRTVERGEPLRLPELTRPHLRLRRRRPACLRCTSTVSQRPLSLRYTISMHQA